MSDALETSRLYVTEPAGKSAFGGALRSIYAPVRTIWSPDAVFQEQSVCAHPTAIGVSVLVLVVMSALLASPVLRAVMEADPSAPFDSDLIDRLLWINAVVLTPLGTGVYLLVIAALLWTFALLGGYEIRFKHSMVIAYAAGVTLVLERLFIVLVLALHQARGTVDPNQVVYTGLEFLTSLVNVDAPLLVSVLARTGIFQMWFVVLLVVGLTLMERMRRGPAVMTAMLAYGVPLALGVGFDLLRIN